jgi:hypothetical protein
MSPEDEDVGVALGEALGHIRNATVALLGVDDPTGESLLLAAQGLGLQDMLGDVWPAYIADERTAAESLAEAERMLAGVIDHVPIGVWAALRSLRQQVRDGQR